MTTAEASPEIFSSYRLLPLVLRPIYIYIYIYIYYIYILYISHILLIYMYNIYNI